MTIFILMHEYGAADELNRKMIGIYSSQVNAEAAIQRKALEEGFCDQKDGFMIIETVLDHDC